VTAEVLLPDDAIVSQDLELSHEESGEYSRPRRKRSKNSASASTESSGISSRERIIAAATELFIAHGYQGTGIQQLSKAAGLSRGALYHHIESKEELLFEISLSLLRPVTESARTIADRDIEPEGKFRMLAQELVMHHAEHGDAWSVVLREAYLLSPDHYSIVIAARDEYEAVWTAIMDEGTEKGTWRKVDPVEIRGILGMMNSSARWMKPRGVLSPEQIATRYVDLILHGIA
jgi:AcrR family transcriptional regulator